MTYEELIKQFNQFRAESSMESRIDRINNDPTIDVMRKRELIADIVSPGRHDLKVEYKPSEVPKNLGRILGLVGGAGAPWVIPSSASPLAKGLLTGLGGLVGYVGGGMLGSGISDVMTGPTITYQPRGTSTYHPLMGLMHEDLRDG